MSKREYNVDLFRIVATLFVITLHVLGQGGILYRTAPDGVGYWVAWALEIASYGAVNCFALISGYVMVDKAVKLKSIIGLWFQAAFYSLSLSWLIFAFVPEVKTTENIVAAFMPITHRQWWYMTAYFGLFFFIPILNAAVNRLPRKTLKKFLLVILAGVGILDCAVSFDAFSLIGGYSAAWLIVLYLFGAYIKKYNVKEKFSVWKGALGYLGMVALTLLTKVGIRHVMRATGGDINLDHTFISYTSVTILLGSIFLFLGFLNLRVGEIPAKAIAVFAPASLGVYLIHVHPLVFQHVILDAFASFATAQPLMLAFVAAAGTLGIYFSCAAIEWARIWLFKVLHIPQLCGLLDKGITALYRVVFERKPKKAEEPVTVPAEISE